MLIEPQRHSQLHILHLPEESTPPRDMHAAKGRFWDQLFACHFVGEFDRDFLELRSFKRGLQIQVTDLHNDNRMGPWKTMRCHWGNNPPSLNMVRGVSRETGRTKAMRQLNPSNDS